MGSSPLTRGKRGGHDLVEALTGLIPTHAGKTSPATVSTSGSRAHPHSRGENTVSGAHPRRGPGSSPLTRGKQCIVCRHFALCGLIPTHAGKTVVAETVNAALTAHPHSRGENCIIACIANGQVGSSPLTRGKHMHTRTQTRTHRLIPTHAGKTGPNAGVWSVSWAHPHSRGENCKGIDRAGRDNGSSPLTRGKHYPHPKTRSDRRLIPTHAGKTCLPVRRRRGPEAHPHSRGENAKDVAIPALQDGSSPLTRGKLVLVPGPAREVRLIPTHAGKTITRRSRPRRSPAHPHSRGENLTGNAQSIRESGSSPLTRGKRLYERRGRYSAGLIPTHAGKTRRPRGTTRGRRAHPHSRGENATNEDPASAYSGSSPLTRGKRRSSPTLPQGTGLIPTHAGKTPETSRQPSWVAAHPHSRGENDQGDRQAADRRWLIPTHAGKTRRTTAASASVRAHPHSRGENTVRYVDTSGVVGSSPLTRGKRNKPRRVILRARLIPTHAGKTIPIRFRRRAQRAHPHSRGENQDLVRGGCVVVGSSPLTRGKHSGRLASLGSRRLIPTHAGKTKKGPRQWH